MNIKDLRIGTRLAGGFIIVVGLTLALGIVAIVQLQHLASNTQDMYDHPLAVSNAMRDIKANIFAMHRTMKDIALSRDTAQIEAFSAAVDEHEKKVYQFFNIVFDRFLGDMNDVKKAHQAFSDWKPIRDEVIRLSRRGEREAAIAITRGKGAKHVEFLTETTRVMIDFAGDKADSFLAKAQKSSHKTIFTMSLLLAAIFILGAGTAFFITQSITKPLNKIVGGINTIALGKLDHQVDIESHDEIGKLADSLRAMQDNLYHKSDVAKQIANGNFDQRVEIVSPEDTVALSINQIVENFSEVVRYANMIASGNYSVSVSPRSADDQLGHAINKMASSLKDVAENARQVASGDYSGKIVPKSNQDELAVALNTMTSSLRDVTARNERQNWLRTGQNKLNEHTRGDLDVITLARNAITFLAKYLEAGMGALYLMADDTNELKLTASYAYAFNKQKGLIDAFRVGEGLIGQAAVEKEIISVTDIPENYVRISSALGEALPLNIIIAPFVYEEKVTGVIELGSFKEFNDTQVDFLELVLEHLAIIFNSARSREQVIALLAETQDQAEALQHQQEELRQTNEELEEQTRTLKESEAHLQTQQEELRVANEELEERTEALAAQGDAYRERNRQLTEAQRELNLKARELEIAGKYKSEFLANMSHELRTPLNSILLLSRLLADNKEKNLSPKQQEFARTINSSGADLLSLINEILDLSKIEAGKMDIRPDDIRLTEIRANMQAAFKQIALDKGLNLRINIAKGIPPTIYTDAQRIEQIVKNLLSNAFKFTEQGEVSINISRPANGTVLSGSRLKHDKTIAFAVKDTGIGIPEDKQAVIFEAFQQADGTTSRKYGGTGLGLSISRELAHLLGGELRIESEAGKGSTFTLYLPERYEGSKAEVTKPEIESREVARIKPVPLQEETLSNAYISDDRQKMGEGEKLLLIIEDDLNFSSALRDLAHEKGFTCLIAEDGKKGLHFADYYKPSAIILDIGLPDMDGWEVMERIKESPRTRHIPVHFITASDKPIDAMKMGAIGYLTKPVTAESLNDAFEKIEDNISKTVKKLLIVEDDDTERNSIVEFIGNGDVSTVAVASGEEAYKLLKNEQFDCMVLDLKLADMTGFDLLAKIRQEEAVPRLPIIVYTGKELSENEELELSKYTESIIIKGAKSPERLLAETTLFLHRVEANLPKERQRMLRMVHDKESVLDGKKILIVDDDMRNVFAITSVLEEKGSTVIVGKNGKDGLEKLARNEDVDLVLMDIMMPEMNGYEAMREIRAQEKYRELPIIALTAKAMKGDKGKCIKAGASEYLAKPVDIEKMLSLLRVWLYR